MKETRMNVQFTLEMQDIVLHGTYYDLILIQWIEDMDDTKVLRISYEWINTSYYLTQRMPCIDRVGESSLTIESLE